MFSPEASIQSARSSLRNPRRRPRRNSDEQQQQHRRKRSKLNGSGDGVQTPPDTYASIKDSDMPNGHAVQTIENSVVLVDMPVREKHTASKRATKQDHALYLTINANYSVKKLPAFPSTLLTALAPFHGTALSSASLALALTHDRATVWDYRATNDPSKVVVLPLQFGLKPSDPLPLGAIVRNGPTNDYGILALAPSSGKISFWESIDSVDTRSMYTQRNQGVEGSVKLYSGESVVDLVDIEHAGHVIVLSSGRLAHLTLRDAQGRLNVTATVMETPNDAGGLFFSFKGLIGGVIRKTIASVKARPSTSKGHMEVISATRSGLFQTWDLSWSGQHNHQRDVDIHTQILAAVQADSAPELRSQQDVEILDFAIMDHQKSQKDVTLLVLVALSGRGALDYSLLEVDLGKTGCVVSRAIPIRQFVQPQLPQEPRGTLLLPQPGHTAYVQFPGAIFVASLIQPEDSPEAQLLADSGRPNLPFQDSIYFREDMPVVFSGTALEQPARRDTRATALIFVQQFGLLQISSHPHTADEDEADRVKVTARSKLEQATFFSTVAGNILDFSIKSRFSFSADETAKAASDISTEILKSSYDYLEKVTSSMDDQLRKRASALRTLASQLQSDYPPLPIQTRWKLLGQAEKLAAAHKLWSWYQDKLQDQQAHPDAYPEKVLMSDIVRALNERYKTVINPELGETDPVRQFFLRDVDSLNILIPWAWFYLRAFYMKKTKEQQSVMQRLSEGTDVMLVVLETAFDFRKANMESYGLDPGSLDDGILKPSNVYDLLPQFWTSSHNIVSSIRSLVDVGRNLAVENYEEGHAEVLAQKIGKDNPRLVKLGCQTHIERFRWYLGQSDEKAQDAGRSLRAEWNTNVRPSHILGLMEIGLATEGMKLAEQYRDMATLVDLVWDESNWLESEKAKTRSKMEQAESTVKLNRIKERISRYFEMYGDEWAGAFYSKYIREKQAGQLFMKEYLNQPALTKFLRADPSRARLAWINEVSGERNYEKAAEALYETSTKQETNAWCQRVELSLAKLAMLCKEESKNGEKLKPAATLRKEKTKMEKMRETQFQSIRQQLEFTKIQDKVYESFSPIIEGAADKDFAVDLLMNEYGQGRLKERPAHQAILKEGFENLVHHRVIDPALMIDILTLMDTDNHHAAPLLEGNEFIFALRVLVISWQDIHRTTRDGLVKLVWKRLCLQDDWAKINNTKDITDAALNGFLERTVVGSTFQGLTKMIAEDKYAQLVWPKKLVDVVGAGGTHGELCVRFPNEDLRVPIIKDNLLDDDILRDQLQKHRLAEWFAAARHSLNNKANGAGASSPVEMAPEVQAVPPPVAPLVDMQSIKEEAQDQKMLS